MSEHEDGYTGAATLTVDGDTFDVQVDLRGHFQPIDGRYRWYGRIKAHDTLSAKLGGKNSDAVISTPEGRAQGQLADPDPWERYRITGSSTPPFAVPTTLAEVEIPRAQA
jgi:hypothetical protein